MVKDFRSSHPWSPGLIVEKIGPVTYCVELGNGKTIRRHVDHIRSRGSSTSPISPPSDNASEMQEFEFFDSQLTSSTPEVDPQPESPISRYPLREHRRPPDRLMDLHI